ncbi:MAG: carboxypeptidase regulatory-like domain-containing protein [Candidatus Aminicenantes bacterium]|nr:carboxypeptidase regulatory-like domain-containing protein [Candidatus Aminicenantes bacterium]
MRKASAAIVLSLLVFFSGTPILRAQDHTGTIQGRIADKSGKALAGATVYLSSPTMLGNRIVLTGKNGRFDFAALAAGIYTLGGEMPGFQTLVRDGINLRTGMSFFFQLEPAPSESEIDVPVPGQPPSLDVLSAKTAVVTDQAQVRSIPLARDFSALLNTTPGAIAAGYAFDPNPSMHGGTVRDNVYLLDGANMTDMVTSAPLVHINVNLTDEIEFITSAQPSSQLPAGGAYVNVVSKSGGNSSAGELSFFFMNDGLNKNLWTSSQITDRGVATPSGDKNYAEPALSLGGPIMADRIWYFLTGRYASKSLASNFIGPYRDILDQVHDPYDWSSQELSAFLKFTVRPIANAKATAWASLAGVYQPVSEDPSPRLPYDSTHLLDHETSLALYGVLDYALNPNAQTYFRAAYISRNSPNLMRTEALSKPWIDDAADLYGPLTGADYNSIDNRQRLQADGSIRLIADNLLGTSHTFSAGFDFDNSNSKLNWWKQDNMLWYMDSRNANANFYADRGLLGFWLSGSEGNSTLFSAETLRLGVFVKDSFSVAGRLTFTLGLRFERDWSSLPAAVKYLSGNALSLFIGDAVVSPRLAAAYPTVFSSGYNPWAQITFSGQNSVISWNALSPRAGLAFDIWGTGRTILKAGYARYADVLSQRYVLPLHPMYPRSLSVFWQDANGDGLPDVEDEFSLPNVDYRFLSGSYYPNRVASGLKAPTTEEISLGLDQELFKDFTLGLHFLSRRQTDILEDVLYAPDTGEYWYAPDQAAAKKYWIPFTTTVPGTDAYPNQTITIYTKSLQAPPAFLQLRNVPELERKYRALEFVFQKRMARGWQLAGSLVLSKAEGNIGGYAEETTAFTAAADSPNYFINQYGRLDTDRPLQIKLMGTVELPFRFGLSAFFHYQSGRPWQRWTQILPPADWSTAHNVERVYYTVNLEASGSRRDTDWSSLDLRLEKEFSLGTASKLGLYADVTNLLGFTASAVGLNDIYSWAPDAEGAGQTGRKLLQPDYGITNALYGQRTFRFGLRLIF